MRGMRMHRPVLDFCALISGNDGTNDTVYVDTMNLPLHATNTRIKGLRMLVLVLVPLMLLVATGSRGAASGEDTVPRNGETTSKTPTLIQVRVPGEGKVNITLENDKGTLIPFTGEIERANGTLAVKPPALVHGTYIVRWASETKNGWFAFSVGAPTAVVTSGTFNPYIIAPAFAVLLLAVTVGLMGGVKRNKKMYMLSAPMLVLSLVGFFGALGAKSEYQLKKVAFATSGAQECLISSNRLDVERCLVGTYVSMAYESTPAAASVALEKDMLANPLLRYYCHHTSHAIGRASYAIYGSIEKAFTLGVEVCDFGYYHGIVEEASGYQTDDFFQESIPTLCIDLTTNTLFYMQCIHGIGHAVAQRTNNDMIRGLAMCERLDSLPVQELQPALNACGTGVTMEWFSVATSGADGLNAVSPTVSKPRDVCTLIGERWGGECYEYIGNTVDSSKPYESLIEIASWCLGSPYENSCYIGLARAGTGLGVSVEDMLQICRVSDDQTVQYECLEKYIIGKATTIDFSLESVDRTCADLGKYADVRELCAEAKVKVQEVNKGVQLTRES